MAAGLRVALAHHDGGDSGDSGSGPRFRTSRANGLALALALSGTPEVARKAGPAGPASPPRESPGVPGAGAAVRPYDVQRPLEKQSGLVTSGAREWLPNPQWLPVPANPSPRAGPGWPGPGVSRRGCETASGPPPAAQAASDARGPRPC